MWDTLRHVFMFVTLYYSNVFSNILLHCSVHHIATMGCVRPIATFENVCHNAMSGYVCHIRTQEYICHIATFVYVCQIIMTRLFSSRCDVRMFGRLQRYYV
jgi:hypothetical protein